MILCYHCFNQAYAKVWDHPRAEEMSEDKLHACHGHLAYKLAEEIEDRKPYPLVQFISQEVEMGVAIDRIVLTCVAHMQDPEADVELFDEWIDNFVEKILK